MNMRSSFLAIVCAIAALVLALGAAEARAQHEVTNVGPPGGDVGTLAISPGDPPVVFATVAHGPERYLYRSGSSSEPSTYLASDVPWIVAHPQSPDTLFTRGRRSVDGGKTWSSLAIPADHVLFNPLDPTTVWATANLGELWVSRDTGNTWDLLSIPPVSRLAISAADSSVLYGIEHPTPGHAPYPVLRSGDGGLTWMEATPGVPVLEVAVAPYNAQTLFATTGVGLFRSYDGGDSWAHLYSASRVVSVVPHPIDVQRLWLLAEDEVLYSADGGYTWQPRGEGLDYHDGLRVLAIDPGQPERLLLGTGHWGVYETVDGGLTWHRTRIAPAKVYSLAIDPLIPGRLLAGTRGQGLLASTDHGASWEHVDLGNLALAWITEIIFAQSNPLVAYATPVLREIMRTDDGGQEWSPRQVPYTSGGNWGIATHPLHPDTLAVATVGRGVLLSTNGGETWNEIYPGGQTWFRTVVFARDDNATLLTAPTATGNLYASQDLGQTWSEVSGDIFANSIHVSNKDSRIYITAPATETSAGGVYRSATEVIEWEALNLNSCINEPAISAYGVFVGSQDRIIVVIKGGLCLSEDDGRSWRKIIDTIWSRPWTAPDPIGRPPIIQDPHIASRLWIWDVEGIKRIDYKPVGTDPAPGSPPALTLHPPFPNPAQSVVHLRLDAATGQRLVVEVFDLLGRRVATLFDEEVTTWGPIDLRWEAKASGRLLPSGTYVVRARSDEHTVEQMVTIVR